MSVDSCNLLCNFAEVAVRQLEKDVVIQNDGYASMARYSFDPRVSFVRPMVGRVLMLFDPQAPASLADLVHLLAKAFQAFGRVWASNSE